MSLHLDIGPGGTADASAGRGKVGAGCLLLFGLPFFLMGCFAIFAGIQKIVQEGNREGFILAFIGGIFALVGAGIGAAAIFGHRRLGKLEAVKTAAPGEPWKWNPDWAAGEIRSGGGKELIFVWFFALFWNAVSSSLLFVLPQELAKGKKEILIGLIFPVVGAGLLAWAIYATLRHRKYGVSVFKLLAVPGVVGGTLRGAVEIPVQVNPEKGFKVRLACIRRVTTGSGKNRSTSEHVQWEDDKVIIRDLLEHDRTRTGIPVFFNLPYGLPDSVAGNPAIVWRLEVSAETPGVDYAAQFEVPVFQTKDSDPEAKPVEDPTKSYQPDAVDYQPPKTGGIRFQEYVHGDVEVYFPPASSLLGIVFSGGFFALWTGAIWLMVVKKAPLILPIIFGCFDIFIGLAFLASLFYSVRTLAGPEGLRIYHRLLVPTKTRHLARDEVRKFVPKVTSQSGSKTVYALQVHTTDGKEYTATGSIPDKRHAEWLATRLARALGLPPQ